MREYNNNEALISIHIPKCGGSSFLSVLRLWFETGLKDHYFNEVSCEMPIKHDLNSEHRICIHGHFNKERGFGIRDYYPDVKQFITMLRDPFEVTISNYFYIKRESESGKSYRDGKLYSVDDLFEYIKQSSSFVLAHMPCDITMNNFREVIEEKFVYVGIVEDIQTSVDCLADKLGKPRVSIGHDNISERNEYVPEDLKEEFIRRHPVEYAMYEYVLGRYSENMI